MTKRAPADKWTHNVQIMRIEMPALKCRAHHDELFKVVKAFERSLEKQFGKTMTVSCVGFYRATWDWDPVDGEERGMRTKVLDNEP